MGDLEPLVHALQNKLSGDHRQSVADVPSLPEETIPWKLHEAQEHYTESDPPFLHCRGYLNPPGTRRIVSLAINGNISRHSKEVYLVSRTWKEKRTYWTLDVNGQRLIVRCYPGGKARSYYLLWNGVEQGFSKIPIAFTVRKPSEYVDIAMAGNSVLRPANESESRPNHPVQRRSSRAPKRKFVPNWETRSISPSSSVRERSPVAPNGDMPPSDESSHTRPKNGKQMSFTDLSTKRGKRSSIKRGFPIFPKAGKSNPAIPSSKFQKIDNGVRNDAHQTDQLSSAPTSALLPTVSEYRQIYTTVYVSLPNNADLVPLKLRSMMTLSTFFTSALEAWDLQGQEANVKALRITFNDLSANDREASWLMKRNIPATFEKFLEVLNDLPVWSDEGKCSVTVEILMHE